MVRHTTSIDGSKINYWIHNPDISPTLLLVHGFRGNHKALTAFSGNFQKYRIILIDLPGYGSSEPLNKKHTLKNYALFLQAFVAEIKLDKYILWGHSYGASICLQYAAFQPIEVEKLILVSPAIGTDSFLGEIATFYYKFTQYLPKRWQKSWLANPIFDRIGGELLIMNVSKKHKAELLKAGMRNLKEVNPKVVMESFLSFLRTNGYQAARKINIPTLIIAGARDKIVPLKLLEQLNVAIVNSQIITIADQGHLSPLEKPAHVATITKDFID